MITVSSLEETHVPWSKYLGKMIDHSLVHSNVWPICFAFLSLTYPFSTYCTSVVFEMNLNVKQNSLFIVTSLGNELGGKGRLWKRTCLNVGVTQSTNSIISFQNEQLYWSNFFQDLHEGILLYLLLVSLSLFTVTTKWGQANKQTNNKKKNNPSIQGSCISVSSKMKCIYIIGQPV